MLPYLSQFVKISTVIKVSLIPLIGALVAGGVWVRETSAADVKQNAAIEAQAQKAESQDEILHRLDNRTAVIEAKVDILLEERSARPSK